MTTDWGALEERVREVASSIWNRPAMPETIAGVKLDCVVKLEPGYWILVEISKEDTLEKLRTDLAKFAVVRPALLAKSTATKCYFVCEHEPPPSLRDSGRENNVEVMSLAQFGLQFFDFSTYRNERLQRQFGSAVDPDTGKADQAAYIPVKYRKSNGDQIVIEDITNLIAVGKKVVLLGEFGTGKSRAFREIFFHLAKHSEDIYRYPIAINLRDNWGLRRGTEIIRRHFDDLGLSHLADSIVKIFERQSVIFLLDGFDEIGSQTWSDDPKRLVAIRQQSLLGVKDLLGKTAGGVLISGRNHYFNSEAEMLSALGLSASSTEIISCHNEFTVQEMADFLAARGKSLTLPDWLPRRPLICQTIAKLPDSDIDLLSHAQGDANFCTHLLDVICQREALISPSLDAKKIHEILRVLARLTRSKPKNFGPLSVSEINRAFEVVVGFYPVDESAVMLQRLPGLGRLTAESSDREFVDEYILEGLRALDVVHSVKVSDTNITDESWNHPLKDLGLSIIATSIDTQHVKSAGAINPFLALMRKSAGKRNRVLSGDILASILLCDSLDEMFSFSGLVLSETAFAHLDFSHVRPEDLDIDDSIIETLTLPTIQPTSVKIKNCQIGTALRVSGAAGLPPWIDRCEVSSFQSISTLSQIKDAELNPAHLILVTIIKKTFFQKGNGRKEEALLRGLGDIAKPKLAERILKLLVTESLLKIVAGDEGIVYVPVRSQTRRMNTMITELSLSKDTIWLKVDKFR